MTKKILLVDYNQTQRINLKRKLESKGYEVFEAENGMEAIRIVYEKAPSLVLTDVIMPSINGYHLCRLIKRDKFIKHIPVIIFTALNKKIDKFWGLRAGADAFFCKNYSENDLISKIEDLINTDKSIQTFRLDDTTQYDFTSKVAEILDDSLVKSTLTNEFRILTEFVLDEKAFNSKLFHLLASILDYNLMGVFYDESDKKDKILYFDQNNADVSVDVLKAVKERVLSKMKNHTNIYSKLKLEYKMFYKEDVELENNDPKINDISEFHSEFIVPIINEGKIIGALALFHKEFVQYADTSILDMIIAELKMVFKIKWLYSETKLLSVIDPLTELYNRRYFQQVLDKEFFRSNRYTSPLSIAMIDIDNFKILNDTYGHQFGDEVLQTISNLFQDSLRKTDYVARYGGEELIAVLPETSLEQAIIPLERLRCKISGNNFMYDFRRIGVTISIGIVQNNYKFLSTDAFLKEADKALYQAKEKGRNRIELADIRMQEF